MQQYKFNTCRWKSANTNPSGSIITITAETSIIDTAPKLGANLDGQQKEKFNTSDI